MSRAWRNVETGEWVEEVTYNRSVAHGGHKYEEVEVNEAGEVVPDRIFGDLSDFDNLGDYEDFDYDYLDYDGGMDYGEAA